MRAMVVASLLIVGCAIACVGNSEPKRWQRESIDELKLVSSEDISGNFFVRQRITFTVDGRDGDFEAVLQRYCGQLVVVGLSPVGTRIFSIRQSGVSVEAESVDTVAWPFDPRRVLLDVHRVYFYPLADPALPDGVHDLRFGNERLTERWQAGRLVERKIALGDADDWIVISYGDGALADEMADPRWNRSSVRLENSLFDYELSIETVDYQALNCEE